MTIRAPLGAAVVLLVFCGWRVMSMGVEMLPTITSNEAIVTLSTEQDMTKEESYAVAENVIAALLAVDNVEAVSYTHLDVYKRQGQRSPAARC